MMMNFCRTGFKILKQTYRPLIRNYASEKIAPLNESTVIGRIVLYMNNEYIRPNMGMKRDDNFNQTTQSLSQLIESTKSSVPNHHISNMKFEEIEDLLRTLKYENFILNKQHFKRLMTVIDTECCSRLQYLDSTSVLRILNVFTQATPNRIRDYRFYGEAINNLMSDIDFLTNEELLQTMFYIGLEKKTKNAQNMLKKCLRKFSKEDINSLTVEELCIICNATFKTSTKITNKQILERVKKVLTDKLYLLKDTPLFVILVKTLRHNRFQDADLLQTISCVIFFNETYKSYPFSVLCHVLAMYADYNFYDEKLIKLFIDLGLKELQLSKVEERSIRAKDITRFLWVLSTLNYENIDQSAFNDVIVPYILHKIKTGEYSKDVEELINIIFYMWMLDYQAVDLLPIALSAKTVTKIQDIQSKTKLRLNLLLTCIFFENKELFKSLNIKAQRYQIMNLEKQLLYRPNILRVLRVLRELNNETDVNKFDVTVEIPHLNICGITGYARKIYKAVFIEVLDDFVCIKNKENMPTGLMQLKLRILKHMDSALIVISSELIEKLSDSDLRNYLQTELELLC